MLEHSEKLVPIPVHEVGGQLAISTFTADPARARALLDLAAGAMPELLLRIADRISRQWLVRSGNPYLAEIDAMSRDLGCAGGHFFNLHYEWGCTTGVKAGAGGPRLVRVLDWRTPGLGRYIIAVRIEGRCGRWVTLTWPGFAGVLQAVAPGRFAAAINQAPMAMPVGMLPADWAVNRLKVWRAGALPPAHLLRLVFEEAPSYADALALLRDAPISGSAIYTLAGCAKGEGAIIERLESAARVHDGYSCVANDWQTANWPGRARGALNAERVALLRGIDGDVGHGFDWLAPPVLNKTTRLAMVADPKDGWLVARGYEEHGPVTQDLELSC